MARDISSEQMTAVSKASVDTDQLVTVAVAPEDSIGAMHEEIEEADARAEYLGESIPEPRREALRKARHILAQYDRTPEHGLVVYTGVVDGDLVEYVFDDLPAPVPETFFDHDYTFDTDPLDAATSNTDTYGLLVVERGGAALGMHTGGEVTLLETLDSDVPGKTRAGGQSAARFERRREQRKAEFFEAVAAAARREFLADATADSPSPGVENSGASNGTSTESGARIDGLVLGGTAVTVEAFRDGDYLDYRLDELLIETYHVEYANEQGLQQLAEKAEAELGMNQAAREALDTFFERLHTESDTVVYGREKTEQALEYDAVETLLVAEQLPVEARQSLRSAVADEGGDCVTISTDIHRGDQFVDGFGGVAALLRFPIE